MTTPEQRADALVEITLAVAAAREIIAVIGSILEDASDKKLTDREQGALAVGILAAAQVLMRDIKTAAGDEMGPSVGVIIRALDSGRHNNLAPLDIVLKDLPTVRETAHKEMSRLTKEQQ